MSLGFPVWGSHTGEAGACGPTCSATCLFFQRALGPRRNLGICNAYLQLVVSTSFEVFLRPGRAADAGPRCRCRSANSTGSTLHLFGKQIARFFEVPARVPLETFMKQKRVSAAQRKSQESQGRKRISEPR